MNWEKCKTSDLFYFLALGLFLTFTVLSTSLYYSVFHGRPFQVMYLICVALLVVQELHRISFSTKEMVGLAVAGALFAIAFIVVEGALSRSVSCIFLFAYCGRRVPFRRIAVFVLNLTFVLVVFVILSGYVGIIENFVVDNKGRVREYLGFRYALFPSAHLLNMISLWVWLKKDKMPLPGACFWAAAGAWMYIKTDSRLSFVLGLCILLTGLILRWLPRILDKLHPVRWLLALSFPLCAAVSMGLTVFYDKNIPWMAALNKALSSRLSLGRNSLDNYGWRWFGQTIDWVGNGLNAYGQVEEGAYDYVDCLYVRLLQNFGPIFLVLFLVLVTAALFRASRRRDTFLLVVLATVAAHCMLDDLSMYLYYNTFWIALGQLLLNPEALYTREPPLRLTLWEDVYGDIKQRMIK